MGVGWKSLSHHISYIVSSVNLLYFNLPTLYEVLSESKYLRANMLDPISLDESGSYLRNACIIVFKDNSWFVILGESILLRDNLVQGA